MAAPDNPKYSFSNGRRWLHWFSTLLAAGAVLAMVVMANYLAAGYFKRFDMDRDSSFQLSRQSRRILESLTNDVNITIFFDPEGANEEVYGLTTGLLNEYHQACPRYIHVKALNYERDIGAARQFVSTNGLAGLKERDLVLIESGGNTKIVYARELSDYDLSGALSGKSQYVRRSAFRGELYFTEDIYDVSNPRAQKAYFLYGHGENDPEDAKSGAGYGRLAAVLKDEVNCDWAKLTLQGTNTIPADCRLLIVAASAHEGRMSQEELDKIAAYLKQGGRLLALLTLNSGLESVLSSWGVDVADDRDRVLDRDKRFAMSEGTFLSAKLAPHPIMNPLASEKMPLQMVWPRPVSPPAQDTKVPGAPQVTILAATSDQGYTELSHQTGSFSLLLAVEQGSIQGVNGGTRMVVAGDSDFLDNEVIDSVGNHFFAQLALDWLLQRPQIMLSGLGPRPIKEYKLYMTGAQAQALRWLFLAGMPGGVLCLGGLVWLRRRT